MRSQINPRIDELAIGILTTLQNCSFPSPLMTLCSSKKQLDVCSHVPYIVQRDSRLSLGDQGLGLC
jgi:hypothetical protein